MLEVAAAAAKLAGLVGQQLSRFACDGLGDASIQRRAVKDLFTAKLSQWTAPMIGTTMDECGGCRPKMWCIRMSGWSVRRGRWLGRNARRWKRRNDRSRRKREIDVHCEATSPAGSRKL